MHLHALQYHCVLVNIPPWIWPRLECLSLKPSHFSHFYLVDNDYEIGEEPEHTWGWNRYKGKSKSGRGKKKRQASTLDGWLTKRKKINNLIDECDAILNSASDRLSKSTNEAPTVTAVGVVTLPGSSPGGKKREQNEDSDSDTVSYDGSDKEEEPSCQPSMSKPASLVECPLCGHFFPHYAIEVHAGSCGESPYFPSAPVPIVLD